MTIVNTGLCGLYGPPDLPLFEKNEPFENMKREEREIDFESLYKSVLVQKVATMKCSQCGGSMSVKKNKKNKARCTRKSCRKEHTICHGSFFKSRLGLLSIMKIIYFLLSGMRVKVIQKQLGSRKDNLPPEKKLYFNPYDDGK